MAAVVEKAGERRSTNVSNLKAKLFEKIQAHRPRITKLVKERQWLTDLLELCLEKSRQLGHTIEPVREGPRQQRQQPGNEGEQQKRDGDGGHGLRYAAVAQPAHDGLHDGGDGPREQKRDQHRLRDVGAPKRRDDEETYQR